MVKELGLWVIRSGNLYAALTYDYDIEETTLEVLFPFGNDGSTIMIFQNEQTANEQLDFYRKRFHDRRTLKHHQWREARVVRWEIKEHS